MGKVRAKMTCFEIRRYRGSLYDADMKKYTATEMQGVKLSAVAGGNDEDNTYSKATPTATVDISITNPDTVGFFELGQSYYVDFSPAE